MRYIKKFEGYSVEDRMVFMEFCKYNLVYLVDNGFYQDVQDYGDTYKLTIDKRFKGDYKSKIKLILKK